MSFLAMANKDGQRIAIEAAYVRKQKAFYDTSHQHRWHITVDWVPGLPLYTLCGARVEPRLWCQTEAPPIEKLCAHCESSAHLMALDKNPEAVSP
jgi:hypothetical protein